MNIGEIRTALNIEKKNKHINEQNLAYDHKASLFYSKDVSSNEGNAKKFDGSLNGIYIYTTQINNLANSYNYSNTCHSLSGIQQKTKKSFYDSIKRELERASLESYTELRTQFDSNSQNINANIAKVQGKIIQYDKLKKEIHDLESEINSIIEAATAAGEAYDVSGQEAKIVLCKNKQTNICSTASSCLNLIKMLNEQNEKLLERGLRKA